MQPKSVWEYISLGIDIGTLRVANIFRHEIERWGDDPTNTLEVRTPDQLIEKFEKLDLLGARGIMRVLKAPIAQIYGNEYLDALIPILESESERIQVFFPAEARWDTQKLLNNVSALFAPEVYASLHDVAQYDFSEAGRCIVFELPTSAAFHLMRGTEKVLRDFYRAMTGKDTEDKNWGPILAELRNSETPSLRPLYDHLKNIKDNYRNPTQHPDKIYSAHEAVDLFGVCIDVIDQMVLFIRMNS